MPLYEHVFMSRQDITTQQIESLVEEYSSIIAKGDGTIKNSEYWGLKPLAYKIKKNRKAHYSLLNIDAPHAAVAEMERQMRFSTDILRFITIKVKQHEEGGSAMMRKNDRDDRRPQRRPREAFNNQKSNR